MIFPISQCNSWTGHLNFYLQAIGHRRGFVHSFRLEFVLEATKNAQLQTVIIISKSNISYIFLVSLFYDIFWPSRPNQFRSRKCRKLHFRESPLEKWCKSIRWTSAFCTSKCYRKPCPFVAIVSYHWFCWWISISLRGLIFSCGQAGYRGIPMVHWYQWYDWYQ